MKLTLSATALFFLLAVAAAQDGPPPAAVTTGVVTSEEIRESVGGVASVEPWRRSVLSVEIAGRVESYPLREGDAVVAGKTVVCELSRSSLLIDLAEAQALLARARAEADAAVTTARASMEEQRALLDQADREWKRAQGLFRDQVVTQAELDRTEAEATAARHRYERAEQAYRLASEGNDPALQALVAEVRRAEASLARVEDRIAKTTILSPLTGLVVRRFVEVGGWVNPGSPVIEVLTLDPVLVRIGVNERDIAKVKKGDPARVKVDAFPDRTFEGEIEFVVPEADPRTRSFPVLVKVPNAEGILRAGLFARVELQRGPARTAMTVPRDAVVKSAAGAAVVTFGEKNAGGLPTARFVPVKVGASVDGRVEVEGEGLAAGMPVVTTGNEMLRPGQGLIPAGAGR